MALNCDGTTNPASAGSNAGLWTMNHATSGGVFAGSAARGFNIARIKRQSHDAKGFHRNKTRWGDRRVPMPFGRGIGFRGDALGSGASVMSAAVSPTG